MQLWHTLRYQLDLLPVRITLLFTALFLGVAIYLNSTVLVYLQADLLALHEQQAVALLEAAMPAAAAGLNPAQANEENLKRYGTRLSAKLIGLDVAIYAVNRQRVFAAPQSALPALLPTAEEVNTVSMANGHDLHVYRFLGTHYLLDGPIFANNTLIGWQAVHLNPAIQADLYQAFLTRMYTGLLATLALVLACGVYLRSYTRRNLQPLLELTQKIAQAHGDAQLTARLTGEFQWLGNAMVQMKQSLTSYEQQRQTLLERISHDILGPLKTVSLIAATHQSPTPALFMQNDWGIVYNCSEHVNRLLEDLKYLMSGQIHYAAPQAAQPLELVPLVEQMVAYYQAKTRGRQVVFTIHQAEATAALCIPMERTRFMQILGNLLDNALTHGKATQITIALSHPTPATMLLKVQDNGVGIAEHILPQIYQERFSTELHAGSDHRGLGLAIITDIVQAYQGAIEVESQLGCGATFTIRLPVVETCLPMLETTKG
ncbi:MAG: HAMP domain-containing sensor histidine kinase [Caldilineaceae bacterium]